VFDAKLSRWYRHVIPALRAADPSHLIWIEPNVFFDFAANTNLVDPAGGDRNTGFDFHTYCLGDGAAAAAPPIPGNGPGCRFEETLNLANASAYQRRSGMALINSEWGATNDPQIAQRQTGEFDAQMIGDVFWDYRNLVPDVTGQPGGRNERAALLDALDRPHPQVVAGTPSSWSFDPGSRGFSLAYTTSLPSGRPAGSLQTEVWVPPDQYPGGYAAAASGADIVSSPGACVLRLVARADVKRVTLTIAPRNGVATACDRS
jgi:endoglycosylceramidase